MKNRRINKVYSDCIEANFLEIIAPKVETIFKTLSRKNPELEKEWKDLFAKEVILFIDSFLKEMTEELEIDYSEDIRISTLRKYIQNIE